ncbi:MAG TPA: cytochrome C [Cytophagales bacterium]|jgi:mono/diheme cytochrome c family protein|nr:cytochrome C [Cytophagales bacterium]
MKNRYALAIVTAFLLFNCAPDKPKSTEEYPNQDEMNKPAPAANQNNPDKGIGAIKEVTLATPIEQDRVKRGQAIYEMKCGACHKLTDQRLVGPGWKDVTHRRKPEWIMNMVTNVDVMLDKDEEAQKLLELCLTRMPNQNVSIGDARDVLEFMRKNDGEK